MNGQEASRIPLGKAKDNWYDSRAEIIFPLLSPFNFKQYVGESVMDKVN